MDKPLGARKTSRDTSCDEAKMHIEGIAVENPDTKWASAQ